MANDNETKTETDKNDYVEAAVAVPILSYVATTFDNVNDAKTAYKALLEERREGLVNIIDAAYIEKTDRSRVKVHDHDDWKIGEGVLAGGVTGAVIGIIGSTILLPAAIGALIGGVLMGAYEHGSKFADKDMRKLGESLPVGTAVLVVVAEDEYVDDVMVEVKKQGGKKPHSGAIPKSTSESLASTSVVKK